MSEAKPGDHGDHGDPPVPPQPNSKREYEHPFWHVCERMPSEYWDYANAVIEFNPSVEPYELLQKIGRGKYSEVFRGRNRANGCICVLKILKPVRVRKINREITILKNLCGGPNIVRLLDVLKDERTDTPILVTEYVQNATTLRTLMYENRLSNFDMRFYLYEVLRSLDFAHRRGIFHRDIKPHNIMIDHANKILRVIDWGLGEYYIHGEALNCGVATRHYKAPELLVGYRHYDFSLDMWCVGCVLAGLLFHCDPFFAGSSNEDQLLKIVAVFGTAALYRYVKKYNGVIPRIVEQQLSYSRKPFPTEHVGWERFIKSPSVDWCDATALDLLNKLLAFDHEDRILPHEAMAHPFFAPVREALAKDPQEQYPVEA